MSSSRSGSEPEVTETIEPELNTLRRPTINLPNGWRLVLVAGNGLRGFSGEGSPATKASLVAPYGLAWDIEAKLNKPLRIAFGAYGSLSFSDGDNHQIRMVGADGTITTMAGAGGRSESGDGGPATMAVLRYPRGLAFDAFGNLYVGTHGGRTIRKIDSGGVITSVPGADVGPIGDLDPAGQLYVGDWASSRITRLNHEGSAEVLLEAGRYAFEESQTSLRIQLGGLALDGAGNIFVTDDRVSHSVYRLEGQPVHVTDRPFFAYNVHMLETLLRTKLYVSPLQPTFEGRPRLIKLLDQDL